MGKNPLTTFLVNIFLASPLAILYFVLGVTLTLANTVISLSLMIVLCGVLKIDIPGSGGAWCDNYRSMIIQGLFMVVVGLVLYYLEIDFSTLNDYFGRKYE